jgi:hypothetical protein
MRLCFVLFGLAGTLLLYAILRMQHSLPWFFRQYHGKDAGSSGSQHVNNLSFIEIRFANQNSGKGNATSADSRQK